MDKPTDAAIRMTALTMVTELANATPGIFKSSEDVFQFTKVIYTWLKESGDMQDVVELRRVQ